MPKNIKKRRNNRPKKAITLQYANNSLKQKYGHVVKALGSKRFNVALLNGMTLNSSLPNGVARRNKRLNVGDLVLVQPMSDDVYGKQEIVTIYATRFAKQLKDEGKLLVVQDKKEEEDEKGFMMEGEDDQIEAVFDEDDIDIDAI